MKTVSEKISFKDPLTLQSGDVLPGFELMTETYGELNSDKSNAVLVCHAFSGNHHAAGIKDGEKKSGWWDEIIGDGKTIDTKKYFVVSLNNLGGCHGSSGPTSIAAESGQPYGASFPEVSVSDWVETQKLLADHLGINCWEMVAGGSLGGMQALQWAVSYPSRIKKAAIIAASSAPAIVPLPYSVAANVDPEEAFVASISSCHMLFFLAIAGNRGFVIDQYIDNPIGIMEKDAAGKTSITNVSLRPQVTFGGDRQPTLETLEMMHHQSHDQCFIANSVKTEVVVNILP